MNPTTAVPPVDSASNVSTRDVIGNKGDGHAGDSLVSVTHTTNEHHHMPSLCHPTLGDAPTVTAAAGAWALGAFQEIVAASAITEDFDIHSLGIEDLSANDVYEVHLYYGGSDTFAGRTRLTKNAVQDGTQQTPFQTIIIPANSRVRAKVATKAGGSRTMDLSIRYHTY